MALHLKGHARFTTIAFKSVSNQVFMRYRLNIFLTVVYKFSNLRVFLFCLIK